MPDPTGLIAAHQLAGAGDVRAAARALGARAARRSRELSELAGAIADRRRTRRRSPPTASCSPIPLHTLRSVLVGWVAAVAIGLTLGLLLGVSSLLRTYPLASIEVLRPMPGIAFAPVALLLFGFSLQMELMVILLPALWPVLINTMGAVLAVHPRLFEVGTHFPPDARRDRAQDHAAGGAAGRAGRRPPRA